jgi:glutamate synthase (NADPH/NADH) large chain
MTGGLVLVLGMTGRNFAAGMSGGTAYVLDLQEKRVNHELVDLGPVPAVVAQELRALVVRHHEETGSLVAHELLADWAGTVDRLTEVMPRDYRRVLDARARAEGDGLDGDAVDRRVMEVLHG